MDIYGTYEKQNAYQDGHWLNTIDNSPQMLLSLLRHLVNAAGVNQTNIYLGDPTANSSKWIHDTFREHWGLEWQEGYGAFSIGISGVEDTANYIRAQAAHHRKASFRQELETFLKKHGMEYAAQDLEG